MIKITGYTGNFLPISLVKAIRLATGVGLSEGKALMEAVVKRQEIVLEVSERVKERSFVDDLRAIGVLCEIVEP